MKFVNHNLLVSLLGVRPHLHVQVFNQAVHLHHQNPTILLIISSQYQITMQKCPSKSLSVQADLAEKTHNSSVQVPSASDRALALADSPLDPDAPRTRAHRRGVSWGQDLQPAEASQLLDPAAENPAQASVQTDIGTPASAFASPFASPFAVPSVTFESSGEACSPAAGVLELAQFRLSCSHWVFSGSPK